MATATVCGGVGCAAALSLGTVVVGRKKTAGAKAVKDCEAAFPTAQLVAALRAKDAKSASPQIGNNIGGGPDLAAEKFAGDLGFAFAEELGWDEEGLVKRTMFLDQEIMKMIDSGCKQLVILAAGLDARAWRLPRLDKSVKIFEVDIPRAVAYKTQKIAELGLETSANRIVVEADLSKPCWTTKLMDAGFQPEQTSFFLIEGLLMYLPPGAPQALYRSVSSLMSSGSAIAGDCFVNCLWFMEESSGPVLAKYGTKWTFDVASNDELVQMLADVSLKADKVVQVMGGEQPVVHDGEADEVQADANKIAKALARAGSWPPHARSWLSAQVSKEGGPETVIRMIVDDASDFQGMKDKSAEHKAKVVEQMLREDWVEKLKTLVRDMPAVEPPSCFSMVSHIAKYVSAMMRAGSRNVKMGYVMYSASKE